MTHINEAPAARGARTEAECALGIGDRNGRQITESGTEAHAVSVARAELIRELLRLGFCQVYAANCQSFLELGDDALALLSLAQLEKASRAASDCGREIRVLREMRR
jgi:hypothetical protein